MLDKLSVAARLLNIIVAVVAGIIVLPGINVVLVLIVLGLISGIAMKTDHFVPMLVAVVALPVMAAVLTNIPNIGTQLGAIFSNFGTGVAASVAMAFAIATVRYAIADGSGLLGGGNNSQT